MITPDGTDPASSPTPRRRPAVLVGIAALVVFAGLMILGVLTSPDPAAVQETTTTTTIAEEIEPPIDPENFTVDQIATGKPLEWELSMAIDDRYPLALLEHEGDLYLFTGSEHLGGPDSAGLMAWRSSTGANWEELGEIVSPDHRITTVDSTVQGLVATAIRRDDGALVLWESVDAIEWTATEMPTGTEGPYDIDIGTAVGANETTLVVTSNARYDRERLLEDRLSALGIDLELSDLAWNLRWLGAEGHHVIVTGPLGIPVLQHPIDELGLKDEERQELLSELFDPLGTDVWVRDSHGDWEAGFIGDTRRVDSIVAAPSGRLVAYGIGTSGRLARTSDDGIDWAPARSTVTPWQAQPWRQRYVGAVNTPDIMLSDDGETWQAAGLSDRFPDELPWAPVALGAGEGGTAMFLTGTRFPGPLPQADITPIELHTDDSASLIYDFEADTFRLISDGTRHEWTVAGETSAEDGIEVDPGEEVVEFRDSETGRTLASVTFTELRRASREPTRDLFGDTQPVSALVFSGDGEDWVIQDMVPEIGDYAIMWLLEVTADRVVAVVRNTVDSIAGGGTPGLEIWSAPVP